MNQEVKPTFDVEEDDSDTPASAASLQTGPEGLNTRRAQAQYPAGSATVRPNKPKDPAEVADASEAELRRELARKERAASSRRQPNRSKMPSPRTLRSRTWSGNFRSISCLTGSDPDPGRR